MVARQTRRKTVPRTFFFSKICSRDFQLILLKITSHLSGDWLNIKNSFSKKMQKKLFQFEMAMKNIKK
jgi:hypothetical protein